MKIILLSALLSAVLFVFSPTTSLADCGGCCSSHGGVDCNGGITMCADGSALSSTCATKGCNVCSAPPVSGPTPSPSLTPQPTPDTEKIRIGSFNIENFGRNKIDNQSIKGILAQIIARFDVIAIQEIRDETEEAIEKLVNAVNELSTDYDYIMSERLGRSPNYQEQYAFIYKTTTISFGESYTYDDSASEIFSRDPFVASFEVINSDFDFVLINVHTIPSKDENEICSLPGVFEDAKDHFPEELDIILLGDLNADCDYFNEDNNECLLIDDSYIWLIGNEIDTNVTDNTSCTYDRIIVTNDFDNELIENANIFKFDVVFDLTKDFAMEVSNHYPVWVDFNIAFSSDQTGSTNDDSSSGGCFIDTIVEK